MLTIEFKARCHLKESLINPTFQIHYDQIN